MIVLIGGQTPQDSYEHSCLISKEDASSRALKEYFYNSGVT